MNKKLIEEAISLCGDDSTRSKMIHDLLKQAIAPKPRFYKNQPVAVSNDRACWFSAVLKNITTDLVDKYFAQSETTEVVRWKHCKPDPDAVSLPNWLPTPKDFSDLIGIEDERILSKDKTMYCIIPDPKFLEMSDD